MPSDISACVTRAAKSKNLNLQVATDDNPFYLRGDFDGDGRPDYAVALRNDDKPQAGLLFCHGSGKRELFGGGSGRLPPGLDEPGYLLASAWEVVTIDQLRSEKLHRGQMPQRMDGEAIYLIWEDGLSLIYKVRGKYVYQSIDIFAVEDVGESDKR